jgi:hypothetical protein
MGVGNSVQAIPTEPSPIAVPWPSRAKPGGPKRGWDDRAGNLAAKQIGSTLPRLRAVAKDPMCRAPKPVL